jgi:hypothetical protein
VAVEFFQLVQIGTTRLRQPTLSTSFYLVPWTADIYPMGVKTYSKFTHLCTSFHFLVSPQESGLPLYLANIDKPTLTVLMKSRELSHQVYPFSQWFFPPARTGTSMRLQIV